MICAYLTISHIGVSADEYMFTDVAADQSFQRYFMVAVIPSPATPVTLEFMFALSRRASAGR